MTKRTDRVERRVFAPKKRKPRKEPVAVVPKGLQPDEVAVIEQEPSFWTKLFKKEKEVVSEDLSVEEMERLEAMEVEVERIDAAETAHPEAIEELEEERESLLQKFFGLFRGYERRHDAERVADEMAYLEEAVIPKIDEDVKHVLKLVHKWLGRLPKRVKEEFRKSNDYVEYKALLEKYGLAKARAKKKVEASPTAESTLAKPKAKAKASRKLDGDEEYPVLGEKE